MGPIYSTHSLACTVRMCASRRLVFIMRTTFRPGFLLYYSPLPLSYDTFWETRKTFIIEVSQIQLYDKLDLFIVITRYFIMRTRIQIFGHIYKSDIPFKCHYKYGIFSHEILCGLEEWINSPMMLPLHNKTIKIQLVHYPLPHASVKTTQNWAKLSPNDVLFQ